MAHYVIVAAKGLDDVGFAVVMNNNGFREIPPSASWYAWRNISYFLWILGGPLAWTLEEECTAFFIWILAVVFRYYNVASQAAFLLLVEWNLGYFVALRNRVPLDNGRTDFVTSVFRPVARP